MRRLSWVAVLVLAATTSARADDDDDEPTGPPVPYDLFSIGAQVGATYGNFLLGNDDQPVAPAVAVEVGFRTDPTTIVGLRIATARLTGLSRNDLTPNYHYVFVPVEIGAFAHAEALGVLWGEVFLGASIDHYVDDGGATWDDGLYLGIAGGGDLVKLGRHRLGVYVEIHSELSGMSFEGISLGVAYRQ